MPEVKSGVRRWVDDHARTAVWRRESSDSNLWRIVALSRRIEGRNLVELQKNDPQVTPLSQAFRPLANTLKTSILHETMRLFTLYNISKIHSRFSRNEGTVRQTMRKMTYKKQWKWLMFCSASDCYVFQNRWWHAWDTPFCRADSALSFGIRYL